MAKKTDSKKLEEELVNLENQLKRAVADYRNLERRVEEDSKSYAHRAKSQLLLKFLPVLDNLEQAVAGAQNSGEKSGWLEGIVMSIKQFRQVLSEEGLEIIEVGDEFDPNIEEAVDVAEGEEGKLLRVLQNGYTLDGKVIRPTRVVVGKGIEK
ncbi:nucleotide exchange factor GrpE [Candidatus Daviesbacteria bacterium]|nr:nucleotide exchange factor GrpE [Candidatus Daviesbacteria bacterium]